MDPLQSSSSWALHGRAQVTTLRVREAFVRERFGEPGHQLVLKRASERLRHALVAKDPADGWIAFHLFVELCELVDRELGEGDQALVLSMGRYSAEHTAGVWRSMFERGMSVNQFVDIAAGIWHRHYDCGRVSASSVNDRVSEMVIDGMPLPHRAHCLSVKGWIEGVFSFSPDTRVQVKELSCRAANDERCCMRLSWR